MNAHEKTIKTTPRTASGESPLAIGTVLEKTWTMYRSLFRPLILVQLAMVIPSIIISAISGGLGLLWLFSGAGYLLPQSGTTQVVHAEFGFFLSILFAALTLCLSAWQQAALILVLRDRAPLRHILKKAARFIPQMLVVMILSGVLIMLGFFVFILPGIFLAVALFLSMLLPITEGVTGIAALKRSYAYIRGSWWKVFSVSAVFVLLLLVASSVLSIPVNFTENEAAPNVYSWIVSLFLAPLGICFTYVVYGALRVQQKKA